jgi:hypothetical protein
VVLDGLLELGPEDRIRLGLKELGEGLEME